MASLNPVIAGTDKPGPLTTSVMVSVACAVTITGVALFIISAMACAGATSSATLGNTFIALGVLGGINGIALVASELQGPKEGRTSRTLKVLAKHAALCAIPLILGVLTRSGHIPLKVMGWLVIGPYIASIVGVSSVGSARAVLNYYKG